MRQILLIGFLYCIHQIPASAQQFYRSPGLQVFNQGLYIAAIDSIRGWRETHEAERGIATYYIGESYYNLGLESVSEADAVRAFEQGAEAFARAAEYPDLSTTYSEKYEDALFKQAWCRFRLAELQSDPLASLDEAYRILYGLSQNGADSLSMHAAYLAAETRLRASRRLRFQVWMTGNEGTQVLLAERGLRVLGQARQLLNRIKDQPTLPAPLKLPAAVRSADVSFERGKWFQELSDRLYAQLKSSGMPQTSNEAALEAFDSHNYLAVLQSPSMPVNAQQASDLYYSEAVRSLNRYLISGAAEDLQRCNLCLDSLNAAPYRADKALLMGARDYAGGMEREAFLRLSNLNQSWFAQAAQTYPEGWYWLGWTQRVADPNGEVNGFSRFLEQTEPSDPGSRIRMLREDAQLQILLMRFDRAASDPAELRHIRAAIESFDPQNEAVARESDLLGKLVGVGLGESIWSRVLQSGSVEDKLTESFVLIRSMLARARRVTGKERVPYLEYLDRLFEITKARRDQETRFYRGMALFLRAEIQETEANKRLYYFAAADTLEGIGGEFRYEGQYIRARSLFAAAKHERESRQDDVYDRAKPIFIRLINEKGSLRSVYYFAEILRRAGNDRAAEACYDVVMEKTRNRETGGFWYSNALAGKRRCRDVGDESVLSEVDLNKVRFPDNLLVIDDQPVSLERFADPEFAQRQIWEEGIRKYVQFGLPKRSIYPSPDAPAGSRFTDRILQWIRVTVRERLSAVESGLRLKVIVPGQIPDDTRVFFNDELMEVTPEGFYEKHPVALNTHFVLRIENGFCYPEIRRLSFDHPGMHRIEIPLIRKMMFRQAGTGPDPKWQIVHLQRRTDDARMLIRSSRPVSSGSQLYRDFESDLKLRDFCYSPVHDAYLAVHAEESEVRMYNRSAERLRGQAIPLTVPEDRPQIASAEGIAVDSQGNIYVADYGGHRVFVFRPNGQFLSVFGDLGKNEAVQAGQPARFTFPSSIATATSESTGEAVESAPILYVADRYGVTMVNPDGLYYESFQLNADDQGRIQDIAVNGFGHTAEILVITRPEGRITRYRARPIQAE